MLTYVIAADKSLMEISKLSQTWLIEHPAFVGHKLLTLPSLYILEIITYVHSCSDYFEIFIDSHSSNTGQNNLFSYLLHTTSARSPLYMGLNLYNHLPSAITLPWWKIIQEVFILLKEFNSVAELLFTNERKFFSFFVFCCCNHCVMNLVVFKCHMRTVVMSMYNNYCWILVYKYIMPCVNKYLWFYILVLWISELLSTISLCIVLAGFSRKRYLWLIASLIHVVILPLVRGVPDHPSQIRMSSTS